MQNMARMGVVKTVYLPITATILESIPLNGTTRLLTIDHATGAKPGQFVNIWLPGIDEKPLSVAYDDGKISRYAVAAIGPFTKNLCALKPGDKIGIRGPFGNTFSLSGAKQVVLVGGGFGSAPLHFLGTKAMENGATVTIIIGARTKNLLMYLDECLTSGFRVLHTTDDGSSGEKGLVTNPLRKLLENGEAGIVQCCGPERMLLAVAKLCKEFEVPSELSLERYMKCGFGICGQCACDGKLICRDGCIFSGEEALTLDDFGKFHRDPEGKKVHL